MFFHNHGFLHVLDNIIKLRSQIRQGCGSISYYPQIDSSATLSLQSKKTMDLVFVRRHTLMKVIFIDTKDRKEGEKAQFGCKAVS